MNYQIFISYRWKNSGDLPGRIYERLTYKDGYYVFYDEQSDIHNADQIPRILSECQAFVLVVGNGSFDRFNDPKDILHLEIKQALDEHKTIVIVQTNDFKMPETLPKDISNIKNVIRLRYIHGHFDTLYNDIIKTFSFKPYGRNLLNMYNGSIQEGLISTFTNLSYVKSLINVGCSMFSLNLTPSNWQDIEKRVNVSNEIMLPTMGLKILSVKIYYEFLEYMTKKYNNIRNDGSELVYDILKHPNSENYIDVSKFCEETFKLKDYLKNLNPQQLFLTHNNRLIFLVVTMKEYNLWIKML